MMPGEYEGHHLKCPLHGRTTPGADGKTVCGCTPHILWEVHDWGEADMRTDNLAIGEHRWTRVDCGHNA